MKLLSMAIVNSLPVRGQVTLMWKPLAQYIYTPNSITIVQPCLIFKQACLKGSRWAEDIYSLTPQSTGPRSLPYFFFITIQIKKYFTSTTCLATIRKESSYESSGWKMLSCWSQEKNQHPCGWGVIFRLLKISSPETSKRRHAGAMEQCCPVLKRQNAQQFIKTGLQIVKVSLLSNL